MELIEIKNNNLDEIKINSCCNGCYNDVTVCYEDLNGLNTYESYEFFNLNFYEAYGFQDIIKPVYIDNERALIFIYRKHFFKDEY